MKLQDEIKFNSQGLIPAIIQDIRTGEVLMMAWMNREAVERTLSTGRTYFWSRSREKLWMKGEKSGHYQLVKEIRIDCDGDSLLIKVNQIKAACHKGYRSCFFRKVSEKGNLKVVEKKVFNPEKVYK